MQNGKRINRGVLPMQNIKYVHNSPSVICVTEHYSSSNGTWKVLQNRFRLAEVLFNRSFAIKAPYFYMTLDCIANKGSPYFMEKAACPAGLRRNSKANMLFQVLVVRRELKLDITFSSLLNSVTFLLQHGHLISPSPNPCPLSRQIIFSLWYFGGSCTVFSCRSLLSDIFSKQHFSQKVHYYE